MKENMRNDLMNFNKLMIEKVTGCNEYTKKFGVTLTTEQAIELTKEHKDALKQEHRIEFGEGILPKLIYAFCDSPYIYQDNYKEMIAGLQEMFYLYKNESLDEVTDDELIEYMKQAFNGECQGSLEFLEDTSLEKFAREVRMGTRKFIGRYGDGEK